ncbi:MAG: hypothetical protein RL033_5939 [Pseudomonadota bacterium]|jgi:hypothetical protein
MRMPHYSSDLDTSRPRRHLRVLLTLVALAAPPKAWSQQPAMPQLPPDVMQQMGAAGGPLGEGMARMKRMTDPNAGKRAGDEKLNCDQIKAEFDETNRQYTIQSEKQDSANAAVEAEAARYQAESSGPGAIAKGFFGGLAALGAQVVGAGDAFNEKAKADLLANEARKQAVLNQSGQEAEATKALADRGQTLVNLGKAKGCKGVSLTQQHKELP